ncbi:protein translocase subunit SecD [Lichenihabitans psoromatis]|uniref:protein translocase subunit SecD n=1 Tax=Lichenihabitans psoromatis TaxID=2528642 RepID=UPI0010384630|nr:protein translocase subunit SecD [Lichenihabitans psoromatis]
MMRFATWKILSILAGTLIAILLVIPSLLPPDLREDVLKHSPSWLPARAIVLGLDLQGGAHVLLEVDANAVTKTQVENLRDDVRRLLREQNVRLTGGVGMQSRGVQLRVPDAAERDKLLPKLQALAAPIGASLTGAVSSFTINQGSDGLIQLTLSDAGINDRVRRAVDQSIEVLRRRVDALGTTEPNIQRVGDDRILVEVPGLQDTQRLKDILGTTAKLEFRLVADPGANPADIEDLPNYKSDSPGTTPVQRQIMVQGEDLTDASPGFEQQTGQPVVNFRFNLRGGQQFGQVTSENVGKRFAIVLDGKVVSAPVIRGAIPGGSGQISGGFTVEEANNLAVLLRAGALPAKLTVVEERTVGPGLGQDSINAGKTAFYVAAALVLTYMITTYGIFGIFADIALAVHILLIFAAMVLLGATLTLPGIAGIVLTIGLAVDANVLIYERIREENHAGRSIISSLDSGFKRAFATIVDSNVTMFVAALILYLFGSGPVRGFAVSLGLGILTSIVTAVTMTRMMIALWYRAKRPTELPI